MAKQKLPNQSRQKLFQSEDLAPVKEALMQANQLRGGQWNPMLPMRMLPFKALFRYKEAGAMENEIMNPDLPALMHSEYGVHIGEYSKTPGLRETVSIPASLVALKVADMIIEGAEPYSQWKEYIRVVDMPTPYFNVPMDAYTDWLGYNDFTKFRATDAEPVDMGGQEKSVKLNCEDNNGYYRTKTSVRRNDIRDNKFLSVEQNLKNAGAAWYFALGQYILSTAYLTSPTNTGTMASLQLQSNSVHPELESIVNVVRKQFPGSQFNRSDTIFFHPTDAYNTIVRASIVSNSGTAVGGGYYPFLTNTMLAPNDEDVINNSGMARAFGLKRAWETPQATAGSVIIVKRDIAAVLGLYQDLEIENFDMTVSGLSESALSMRLDVEKAQSNGLYVITSFS